MLYWLSGFRPHSSSDPLTRATFPPGEGFWWIPLPFISLIRPALFSIGTRPESW